MEVDLRGAGDYIPKADAKIRRIKDSYMHIDGQRSLVTVCKLLQLTIQVAIER